MGVRSQYSLSKGSPANYSGELAKILETEFSDRFVEGMKNRMIVSHHKYGFVGDNCPGRVDVLASLEQRLEKYRETGNAEWLIDVANMAMIEFMHPAHPDAHMRATDSHESPGRVRRDGGDPSGKISCGDTAIERLRAKYLRREGD